MHQSPHLRPKATRNDTIHQLDLNDILPGYILIVNISTLIVSLIIKENEPYKCIVAQRVLTDSEIRVLLPLFASPSCCPQEVLQASCYCVYEVLLQAMFSHEESISTQWNNVVQNARLRLSEADLRGARRTEMRGVYNALFSLRQKLEQLGLTIRSRKDGYYLSPLSGE